MINTKEYNETISQSYVEGSDVLISSLYSLYVTSPIDLCDLHVYSGIVVYNFIREEKKNARKDQNINPPLKNSSEQRLTLGLAPRPTSKPPCPQILRPIILILHLQRSH